MAFFADFFNFLKLKKMVTKRLFFQTLSPSQEKILLALARYKYLTAGQLLRLGIMSDRANLNKQIAELRLRKDPLVGSIAFGVHPAIGKLENVHFLKAHGAEIVKDYLREDVVRFPKNEGQFYQKDYFHRMNMINVQIALHEGISKNDGCEIMLFSTYFDKVSTGKKKGYRAESSIQISENDYLIADALCTIQTSKRKELYAIEMYNGDDTNRVHKSLFHHLKALSVGQPSRMFGLDYGSRILCIFELEVYKQMAMKRLSEDNSFAEAKFHFLFKSLEEIKQNAFEDWWLFDGTQVKLF